MSAALMMVAWLAAADPQSAAPSVPDPATGVAQSDYPHDPVAPKRPLPLIQKRGTRFGAAVGAALGLLLTVAMTSAVCDGFEHPCDSRQAIDWGVLIGLALVPPGALAGGILGGSWRYDDDAEAGADVSWLDDGSGEVGAFRLSLGASSLLVGNPNGPQSGTSVAFGLTHFAKFGRYFRLGIDYGQQHYGQWDHRYYGNADQKGWNLGFVARGDVPLTETARPYLIAGFGVQAFPWVGTQPAVSGGVGFDYRPRNTAVSFHAEGRLHRDFVPDNLGQRVTVVGTWTSGVTLHWYQRRK